MMQKKWFKLFIWFISTALFFAAAGIIIATYGPNPSEQQSMSYMSGMMKAMENSLMGLSMTIEGDTELKQILIKASSITSILIVASIIAGFYVRGYRRKKNG
ncbi:hypothetical protein [Anaeromicropila herbilytica]|uniref:Uncharacterized protein n=1 Tax=Anaeromicropila herbilytica TaxID=2785025 RepID=A0A7R7IC73_9FIRM|nr:hypothetical protein [Anaeromicropila herbilytica]BCN29571.1 hypothetical protein bsdtb5_08660 [Anaeromicropila herbilytica]